MLVITAVTSLSVAAKENTQFDDILSDSTLRLDLVLSGDAHAVDISLSGMHKSSGWWGRRVNLSKISVPGNGQAIVKSQSTGDTIYTLPFSTLFQEWLSTPESTQYKRAEDLVINIPLPKDNASIEVKLFNNRREIVASSQFPFSPDNVNIRNSNHNLSNFQYIHKSGDGKDKIDVAILAEGYTTAQMDTFVLDAQKAVASILAHEPFKSRSSEFNFVAVMSPSIDSGASVPQDGVWRSSAFDSHYNTFDSPRYLTTSSIRKVHDALQGIPYEHIIILVNDDVYGGGGIFNFFALTTARHKMFDPVVVHEFGHSFGGLADEYFYDNGDALDETYPLDVEPWEGNITTLQAFDSKWKPMLAPGQNIPTLAWETPANGVGVFEGGAYRTKGIYRPVDKACRMRFNEAEAFCPVCRNLINRMIDFNLFEEQY